MPNVLLISSYLIGLIKLEPILSIITNLMPVYEQDGTVLEYRISVDNGATDGSSVSANLVVKPTDIDLTAIAEVCKQKLRETVG